MNRLQVYIRLKPTNEKSIIDIVDDRSIIFDPLDPEQPVGEYFYHGQKFKSIGSRKCKNSSYTFDRVFTPQTTNHEIFKTATEPMLHSFLDGYNCSVFAYGATGSGKTYTMLGNQYSPGVIFHTSKELFSKLERLSDPLPPDLKICYFEIYNEKVRDLLVHVNYIRCGNKKLRTTPERQARQQDLPVRDAGDGNNIEIPNLTYHKPANTEQLLELIEVGNSNRSQHPTDANADSSRSHAIFQLVLKRRMTGKIQLSKMSLIDLAGSERASVAYRAGNNRGKSLQREGGNINKSLLALGNCINALADPKMGNHVPYRNSKLTRMLRDSLGGSCQTAMIATVCQQSSRYDDTQSTLLYASRARSIKLKPGRNMTDINIQPKNYNLIIDNQAKQIMNLQSEKDELSLELQKVRAEFAATRTNHHSTTYSNFIQESRYKSRLEQLYDERRDVRLEILSYESKLRKNELKLTFKKMDEARYQVTHGQLPKVNGNSTILIAPGVTSSLQTNQDQSQALRAQLGFFEQERRALLEKARINEMHMRDTIASMTTEFELKGFGSAEEFDKMIEPYLCERERYNEIEEKKFCEQHAFDIAQDGINRLMATENLLIEAAHVVRYIHAITKGRGLSDSSEAKISRLFKKLEGKKNVVWKDDKYAMETDKDEPLSQLLDIHENFSLNFLTPFKNNNTLCSRRLSKNLVSLTNYTPEQSNITFDASQ